MQPRSILDITQGILDEVQYDNLNGELIGADTPIARQMVQLALRAGDELLRYADSQSGWPILQKEHRFSTVGGQAEYDLPPDYERIIGETLWNRSENLQPRGPASPFEAQAIEYGLLGQTITDQDRRYRIVGGKLRFYPAPTHAEDFSFLYISGYWIVHPDKTLGAEFLNNADTIILDEWLFSSGLKSAFMKAKEIPGWETERLQYEQERAKRLAEARGVRPIFIGGGEAGYYRDGMYYGPSLQPTQDG